jgi:kynureninase
MLDPLLLQKQYSDFLSSSDRILLTGHSHQAWPNQARKGVIQAFEDAALYVDDKWNMVFKHTDQVRTFIAQYCHAHPDEIALGQNTHELFTRFLSALPLDQKNKIVVSTGEFHSVYRQLVAFQRSNPLVSSTPKVVWVDEFPVSTLADRLAHEVDSTCSAVICSTVLFQTGTQVPHLQELASRCTQHEVRLFLDAYHSFQSTPFDLNTFDPNDLVYLSGGGYKYAQWGEGACWLRVPAHDHIQPSFTGWFSDFEHLHEPRNPH